MSSAKMTPPTFDRTKYRSSLRGAYSSVTDFLTKFRGWAQATNISTKVGPGGDCPLAWACITDPITRRNYAGYPPAHGPGSTAKSKALHRSAQAHVHYVLLNAGLLDVIPSEFKTYNMEAYDDPDLAVDGEPCPVGTKIIECRERTLWMVWATRSSRHRRMPQHEGSQGAVEHCPQHPVIQSLPLLSRSGRQPQRQPGRVQPRLHQRRRPPRRHFSLFRLNACICTCLSAKYTVSTLYTH